MTETSTGETTTKKKGRLRRILMFDLGTLKVWYVLVGVMALGSIVLLGIQAEHTLTVRQDKKATDILAVLSYTDCVKSITRSDGNRTQWLESDARLQKAFDSLVPVYPGIKSSPFFTIAAEDDAGLEVNLPQQNVHDKCDQYLVSMSPAARKSVGR